MWRFSEPLRRWSWSQIFDHAFDEVYCDVLNKSKDLEKPERSDNLTNSQKEQITAL